MGDAPRQEQSVVDGRVGAPLPHSFFDRDPREVAPDLIGKVLVSSAGGAVTGGVIVETEAYLGSHDPGSHAATRGMTPRNAVMYGPPGTVYVYFTYGNHHMLNLVCGSEGEAGAVLVRALEPAIGAEAMRFRRAGRSDRELASGPGKLAAALGIDLSQNRTPLGAGNLVVYDAAEPFDRAVETSGRIGLSAGHELELRYFEAGSPFVSRGRTGPPPGQARRSTHTREGSAR